MANKWIRLKDRRPEIGRPVLCWDVQHEEVHLGHFLHGMTNDDGTDAMESLSNTSLGDYDLQYWMSLPFGPNVEEPNG